MKKYLICYFPIFLNSILLIAQTNTTADGNWNTSGNWNNGVPADDDVANVNHQIILNTDLTIDDGTYTVNNGSITDPAGGTKYEIEIKGDGYFEIGGNVTIGGDLKAKDDAELFLKGCDTLIVGGKLEFKDDSKLTVEDCTVLIVLGNAKFEKDAVVEINGNVVVGGKLETKNDAVIIGNGNINVTGETKIKNSSSIFGSTTPCNPGPCNYGSGGSLPIELISFDANLLANGTIQLSWFTASETNNDYFTLERADNNGPFIEISKINGAGNSQQTLSYKYTDDSPLAAQSYYRLKQTDFDGVYSYSETKLIKTNDLIKVQNNNLKIYPNPANDLLYLTHSLLNLQKLNIYNVNGTIVKTIEVISEQNPIAIRINNLDPGIYFIKMNNGYEQVSEKFIIAR